MAEVKLTKNALRLVQRRLAQLEKYLPTLQIKKAMLQAEIHEARLEIERRQQEEEQSKAHVDSFSPLLHFPVSIDPIAVGKVTKVHKHYDNIAGVEVPLLDGVEFAELTYSLFETPSWVDGAIFALRKFSEAQIAVQIAREKRNALERELREVSIRVNLFEKVLIPRSRAHIKTIKVFLSDQELSAVGRAKAAKNKIEERARAKKGTTSYAL